MRKAVLRCNVVCLFSLFALGLSGLAWGGEGWTPAVTAADIDVAGCAVERAGKALPVEKEGVLAALGLGPGPGWPGGERHRGKERIEIVYTLAFNRDLPLGTIMVRAATAIEAQVGGTWQALETNAKTVGTRSVATLPVGFKAKALRFTQTHRGYEPLGLSWLRLYQARLVNVMPAAVANGKTEHTAYHRFSPPTVYAASRIPAGTGAWVNAGLEPGEDAIKSPPITDVSPTWFMVSWDVPQTLLGLHVDSNITALELYEYTGPAGLNPVVATPQEWRKVRGWTEEDAFGGNNSVSPGRAIDEEVRGLYKYHKYGPTERTLRFKVPLATRGLKLLIQGVEPQHHTDTDQVARIGAMHAYVDLGEEPLPDFSLASDLPPFPVDYELEKAGTVTLVLDRPDGTRVRNLLAREWQEAGPQTAGWDLKDVDGEPVAPGTYHWKGLTGPVPYLSYEMTAYPNVRNFHPENTPWRNGHSGSGGWLADHGVPTCVAAHGDQVYLGSPVCESGESLAECDTAGKRLWGHGNFLAFTGPSFLAANSHSVYVGTPVKKIPYTTKWREIIFRVDRETHETESFIDMQSTHSRFRGMVGLAAGEAKVYVAVRAKTEWLVNACGADDVDILNCLPKYAEQKESNRQFNPNPRNEFLRLLRLTGTPPGQRGSLNRLESTDMPAGRQHLVVAFKRAVPIGSLVFPFPRGDYVLKLSVLKPDAPYPPNADEADQWRVFYEGEAAGRNQSVDRAKGWAVVAAARNTTTRALRITFDKAEDELDAVLEEEGGILGGQRPWQGTIDGMKILRRRYENLFPTATVRVNSGQVEAGPYGTWDAKRTEPLTAANPAIYALEWDGPQAIRGLAIMELDGKDTRVDVFEGEGAVDIEAEQGWREVAVYNQPRRYFYQPDANRNTEAIYMDGYVDFGRTLKTRAVRLRIVSQWTTRAEGRAGLYGVREDRGGMELDPTRCHVYGVAPLRPLGGDAPIDPMAAERLEVFDAKTGKLLSEAPYKGGSRLTVAPDGALYGVRGSAVVRVAPESGQHEVLTEDPELPDALAVDKAGTLYVFDRAAGRQNIRVYSAAGEYERSIGKPGGIQAGPWDPECIGLGEKTRVDLAIDGQDQLWVAAAHRNPKRQSVWTLDGAFIREHLGNTRYGGGGVLNPWNKEQLFYSAQNATLEFALDWETGLTALKAVPWLGNAAGGELPVQIEDRLYLCTRPRFGIQGCGIVYRYQEMRMQPVAALGLATFYPPLRTPAIEASLDGRALGEMDFVWSDRSGDGQPQVDEITFTPTRFKGVSWFDRDLGVQAGTYRFEVSEFLPSGVPLYTCRELPNVPENDPGVKLGNDQIVFFEGRNYRRRNAEAGYTLDGSPVWRYPTEGYGVHALTKAKPWHPAQVVSEFDIIGFAKAHAGDLGDFFITNSNIGRWNLWTADGLLAGEVMRDRRDPQLLSWSMTECERGMKLPGLTPGSEHFHGAFCRSEEDGKYYLVAGHNHISVLEIHGLDQYRRLSGSVEVKPEDIRRVQAWERAREERAVYARAPVYRCLPAKETMLDGNLEEWSDVPALTVEGMTFRMTYSATTLYLAYHVRGMGPFKNQGNDWRRMFKTGAAVDLQMSVKPDVDRGESDLAEGDFRLLMTPYQGKPLSVIYQPVAPGAPESAAWETYTMVWRTGFERVAKVPEVNFAFVHDEGTYVVEAAVPLETIGLQIRKGLRLKFDWGALLTSAGGTEVLRRLYWANKNTAIISDEAAEAQINPKLWGHVIFQRREDQAAQGSGGALLQGNREEEMTEEDVLDMLEE